MIEVVNIRDYIVDGKVVLPPHAVYIGRAAPRYGLKKSPLANPYPVGQKYGKPPQKRTLEESLALYAAHLAGALWTGVDGDGKRYPTTLRVEVDRLRALHKEHGKLLLACWCKPKACHGDVIKEVLEAEE